MKYLYYDLGEQQAESCVVVHLRGSWANVILVDPLQFARYRRRQPFWYSGGFQARTPARLRVPHDGHWYLVIDCGGFAPRARPRRIEVLAPDSEPASLGSESVEPEMTTAGASA